MVIKKEAFGPVEGREAALYTVENDFLVLKVTDFGAAVVSLIVKGEKPVDVVLGLSCAGEYAETGAYLGGTVGRVCNRIEGARFTLEGAEYPLFVNDNGANCLHGGEKGFSRYFYDTQELENGIAFSRVSPHMEEGFPGSLDLRVAYRLVGSELHIEYTYSSDRRTPVSVTNHSYFNLNGEGDVLSHSLMLAASRFCAVDSRQIPIMPPMSVEGTPFDFRTAKAIGRDMDNGDELFSVTHCYDHAFIFDGGNEVKAVLTGDSLQMTVTTDMPGVQLYVGSGAVPFTDKYGRNISGAAGACLETQFLPNGLNHGLDEMMVLPGKIYKSSTVYSFKRLV